MIDPMNVSDDQDPIDAISGKEEMGQYIKNKLRATP